MNKFLPTTKAEMDKLGWKQADIILVTGDTYFDSPYIGVAVIGRILESEGYKVGIIAQPDINTPDDITRLGEPKLYWGVSGGSVDSMVANYTASKKRRKSDDFTPGGINNRRPDRASIIYTNLIKKFYKRNKPIMLGGIEASLRRVVHYDFWSDKLRRSILIDAEADYLLYGMSDISIIEFTKGIENLKNDKNSLENVRGLCYISKLSERDGYIKLPSYEECQNSQDVFTKMFHSFYNNNDPQTAKGLIQQQDRSRFVVLNPPPQNLTQEQMDKTYNLDYTLDVHPFYKKFGHVKAVDTIQFSVTSHRGCYGECNFCAIAVHQGRAIQSRSEESIIEEVVKMTHHPDFKGIISDVGGPSANMYGYDCAKKEKVGSCLNKRCISTKICPALKPNHKPHRELLKKLRGIEKVKKIFVASGLRYDMILEDKEYGDLYLEDLVKYHISGQLKIAPEHTDDEILSVMSKPSKHYLEEFYDRYQKLNKKLNKNQFLSYYLIAAHPASTIGSMKNMQKYFSKNLHILPEQVQIFTPTPSTYSSLMYYTQKNPFTGNPIFVEKDMNKKEAQKRAVTLPKQDSIGKENRKSQRVYKKPHKKY